MESTVNKLRKNCWENSTTKKQNVSYGGHSSMASVSTHISHKNLGEYSSKIVSPMLHSNPPKKKVYVYTWLQFVNQIMLMLLHMQQQTSHQNNKKKLTLLVNPDSICYTQIDSYIKSTILLNYGYACLQE